jgi:hypothetical protein
VSSNLVHVLALVLMLPPVSALAGRDAQPQAWTDNPQGWAVEHGGSAVRYITQGQPEYGHTFGFVKVAGECQKDVLWLTWTTQHAGLEVGTDVPMLFAVDGNTVELSLPVVEASTMDMPEDTLILLFTDVRLSDDFVKVLSQAKAKQLTLTIAGRQDSFSLQGFSAARSHAV